jgi:predicted nucleic acid-binding protein
VIASGVLLDAGPLVALLSENDANHERAVKLVAQCAPPLRCCEAVVAEACFLARRRDANGPAKVLGLARVGAYEIAIAAHEHWAEIEALLRKYADQPISFADASLIRCAEIHHEARILTFDGDFKTYRWSRNKKFEILQA